MKLRNKKTGEVREIKNILLDGMFTVKSLSELNAEWEDYEELKSYWFINGSGLVYKSKYGEYPYTDLLKEQIGNYFDTREEAEKAVEKLKAWKRLKDKGFRFTAWYSGSKDISFSIPQEIIDKPTSKDLDLLFGGEE